MSTIVIIDDRKDLRETLKNILDGQLVGNWNSIACGPLSDIHQYPSWILENNFSVAILDERLHEQIEPSTDKVNYNGHHIVDIIRTSIPTFPIFIITTWPKDEDLKEKFKDVEEIIERNDFYSNAGNYVPRILRASQQYSEAFQKELFELSDIAKRIAEKTAIPKDFERFKAIREKINLAIPSESFELSINILEAFEKKLDEFEELKSQIDAFLKDSK